MWVTSVVGLHGQEFRVGWTWGRSSGRKSRSRAVCKKLRATCKGLAVYGQRKSPFEVLRTHLDVLLEVLAFNLGRDG